MGTGGLLIVDKPGGMTSHDVVSRIRRVMRTRRVGHGGTLDPMATGVLVIGVERATRLLTYVVGTRKRYAGTIRLGQSTITDDAEGDITATADASGIDDAMIAAEVGRLTGAIRQVPSAVSAIKVGGVRSYARVRNGEDVVLDARPVTVHSFRVTARRRADIDVEVECSAGTYIRALARDLGTALGVGGHLTALRRTAVGDFTLDGAVPLDEVTPERLTTMATAVRRILPARELTDEEARVVSYGGPIAATGVDGPYAVFDPAGDVMAVVRERDGKARSEVVLKPAGG